MGCGDDHAATGGSSPATETAQPVGLESGEFLPAALAIEPPDGYYVLRMERSGNLVLRERRRHVVVWDDRVAHHPVIEDDETMVIQAPDGTSTWSNATHEIGAGPEHTMSTAANARHVT